MENVDIKIWEYPLNNNLKVLLENEDEIKLISHSEQILYDEEYMENGKLIKCFVCDKTNIKQMRLLTSEFLEDYEKLGFPMENYDLWESRVKNMLTESITITFCEDCFSILAIDETILFLNYDFNMETYMNLLQKRGYLDETFTPIKCIYCDGEDFSIVDTFYGSVGIEEYKLRCNCCNRDFASYAYGTYNLI